MNDQHESLEINQVSKVFCPDCGVELQPHIHQQCMEPFHSYLYFYCPGRCHLEACARRGLDQEQVYCESIKFRFPLGQGAIDIDPLIARVSSVIETEGLSKNVPLDKEIQGLRHELSDKAQAIESALQNLKKAGMVLNHWFNEYVFAENPDPRLAIAYSTRILNGDPLQAQSFKWFYEYKNITQFIDIVNDYLYKTERVLNQIL